MEEKTSYNLAEIREFAEVQERTLKAMERVLVSLEETTFGRVTHACKVAGVSTRQYQEWRKRYPSFASIADEAILNGRSARQDAAENVLDDALSDYLKNPNAAIKAAIFVLETQGKARGWGKQTDKNVTGIGHKMTFREFFNLEDGAEPAPKQTLSDFLGLGKKGTIRISNDVSEDEESESEQGQIILGEKIFEE